MVGKIVGILITIILGGFAWCSCILSSKADKLKEEEYMNEWETMTARILKAIEGVQTDNTREKVISYALLMHFYKITESEEKFNDVCELLNKAYAEEISNRRFGK